jgi:hypothetical protein
VAGTAKNYDVTRIHQGPGDLWIIGGGVADSATPQLTIATDGTPDATAHPASVHLGSHESAVTIAVTPKIDEIMIDQADGPVARFIQSLEMSLEVELKQLDPTIIQNCAPMGTFATSAGYKQLTFGGQAPTAFTPVCVAFIAPKRAVASKFVVSVIFSAQGMLGLNTQAGRAKASMYKAQFKGLTDLTRTAGRQMGVVYETN